jgi:hypothetical protein
MRSKELRKRIREAKEIRFYIDRADFYVRITKKVAVELAKAEEAGNIRITYNSYSGSGTLYLVIR